MMFSKKQFFKTKERNEEKLPIHHCCVHIVCFYIKCKIAESAENLRLYRFLWEVCLTYTGVGETRERERII